MGDSKTSLDQLLSLAAERTPSCWLSICHCLDKLEEQNADTLAECVTELLKTLSSWPDSLRVCPANWFDDFVLGRKSPKFSIVHSFATDQLWELAISGRIQCLLESKNLTHIRVLDLTLNDHETELPEQTLTIKEFHILSEREDVTITSVDLCTGIDIENLKLLLRSKAFENCRHLGLPWAKVAPNELVDELVDPGCLLRLESLDLNWTSPLGNPKALTDDGLQRLMQSDASRNLKTLRVKGYDLTERGIEALAQAPNCKTLERLEISSIAGRDGGDAPIEKLAASPYLSELKELVYLDSRAGDLSAKLISETRSLGEKLTHLELAGEIGEVGANALANSKYLANLAHLNLSLNQSIGESGCLSLANAHWMKNLDHIDLSCVAMTNTALEAMLSSIGQPTLLDVGNNRFTTGALTKVATAPGLRLVRTLDLASIKFERDEIEAFVDSPILTEVESLSLRFCCSEFADELLVAIAQSSQWQNLKSLDVSHTRAISDKTLIAIAKSSNLKSLTKLDLRENNITSEGLVALSESKVLAQMTELCLDNNKIGDEGAIALARSGNTANLRKLTLYSNQLTPHCGKGIYNSPLNNIQILKLSEQSYYGGLGVGYSRSPGIDESLGTDETASGD